MDANCRSILFVTSFFLFLLSQIVVNVLKNDKTKKTKKHSMCTYMYPLTFFFLVFFIFQ